MAAAPSNLLTKNKVGSDSAMPCVALYCHFQKVKESLQTESLSLSLKDAPATLPLFARTDETLVAMLLIAS